MVFVILAGVTACLKKTTEDQHGSHDASDMNFMHIHGLGYSSDGKRLFIPVHNGLKVYADGKWTDAPGDKHDYMGFSAADNGFYSSGHPAVGSTYKNPLGLIKSTDEGKSITVLALEGEVDLHGMSVSYQTHTLYVLNPEPNSKMRQAGLFYSKDEAKTWTNSRMDGLQGQITALSVHPTQDSVIAIGTGSGAYLSKDHGQTFAAVYSEHPVSSLAFTNTGDLLIGTAKPDTALMKVNLETKRSVIIKTPVQGDNGITYLTVNPVNTKELVLATENKDVYVSTDNGVTWRQIADKGQAQNS